MQDHLPKKKYLPRQINGILILDKPIGISSNAALQQVKRLFEADKAGHTGSLDPLATGLLPICFGEATKFSQHLLDADKIYQVTAQLGITTSTGDAEGNILATQPVHTSLSDIQQVLAEFVGETTQIPPMYSALKYQGRPLYQLARKGIEVERKPRKIIIHHLDLIKFENDSFILKVHCSKGTYIRTLIEDIGNRLGCGAHVTALRRLQVQPFFEKQMLTISELLQAKTESQLETLLHPIESSLANWPKVELNERTSYYLNQGQSVMVPNLPEGPLVKLYNEHNKFIGVGEIIDNLKVKPHRLLKMQVV